MSYFTEKTRAESIRNKPVELRQASTIFLSLAIQPFPITVDELLSQAMANISTFMPNVISSAFSIA